MGNKDVMQEDFITQLNNELHKSAISGLSPDHERNRQHKFQLTRFLIDMIPDLAFWMDSESQIFYVNDAACRSLGYSKGELLSMNLHEIDPNYPKKGWKKEWEKLRLSKAVTIESKHKTKRDKIIPVEVNANFVKFNGKEYNCAIVRDITERKDAERAITELNEELTIEIDELKRSESRIRSSLKEKELFVEECRHRHKNNLQFITSLLDLQREYEKDNRMRNIFVDVQNRVRSMALINDQVCQSIDNEMIDLCEYISELATYLLDSYVVARQDMKLDLRVPRTVVNKNVALRCGLIVNELISNSLKHAFPDNRQGKIRVEFRSEDANCILTVADDGIGLPFNVDSIKTESMGLELVKSLTRQMAGSVRVDRKNGTEFKIVFPEDKLSTCSR